jgi:NitT/TauT family transport system permease protein
VTRAAQARALRWGTALAALAAVEAVARAGLVRPSVLVPVSEMLGRLAQIAFTGTIPSPYFRRAGTPSLFLHLGTTLEELGLSFLLAALLGLPLGALLWRVRALFEILNPYLVAYYAVPVFALYPLFILLFGSGMVPIVLIGFLFGAVVIVTNTASGFRRVDGEVYPRVARSLHLGRAQTLRWIYLPAAGPFVFTGLKLGFIYCLIGVVAAEFIVSTRGLGHIIDRSYRNFETANMYAGIWMVLLLALAANGALGRLEAALHGRFRR